MEWIVTTGATVDEARDLALDQLGVAVEDAEFEVVAEPSSKWLGLRTTPAQVRARVRPVAPPPKIDRHNRQRDRRRGRDKARGKGGDQRRGRSGGQQQQKKRGQQGAPADKAGANKGRQAQRNQQQKSDSDRKDTSEPTKGTTRTRRVGQQTSPAKQARSGGTASDSNRPSTKGSDNGGSGRARRRTLASTTDHQSSESNIRSTPKESAPSESSASDSPPARKRTRKIQP